MARGRKPDPAAVREAKGNPGKRPVPREAAAPAGKLARPSWLTGRARKLWESEAPKLAAMNLLRPSDGPAFARYCKNLARWIDWSIELDRDPDGAVYWTESNHGRMKRGHPHIRNLLALERALESAEDRFGMSPRARQEIMLKRVAAGAQPDLPLASGAGGQKPEEAREAPAAAKPASPIGALGTGRLH